MKYNLTLNLNNGTKNTCYEIIIAVIKIYCDKTIEEQIT